MSISRMSFPFVSVPILLSVTPLHRLVPLVNDVLRVVFGSLHGLLLQPVELRTLLCWGHPRHGQRAPVFSTHDFLPSLLVECPAPDSNRSASPHGTVALLFFGCGCSFPVVASPF